jgi:hypothetical protein
MNARIAFGIARFPVLFPLLLALAGCSFAQTPYVFAVSRDPAGSVDAVTRALATEGVEVIKVNRNAGIVTSKWVSRGNSADGVFVSRYTVIVAPSGAGSMMTLREDVLNCPPGGYSAGSLEVMPTCHAIEGILPGDQSKIDGLGARLAAAVKS